MPDNGYIDIVFDGPPGPEGEARFIEVEDASGRSISCRTWIERPDGSWVLRITAAELTKLTDSTARSV